MRLSSICLCIIFYLSGNAQSPEGIWVSVDDKTGKETSHIEIYSLNNKLYGRVVKLLRDEPDSVCERCRGNLKNQPIIGMVILRELVLKDDRWSLGYILDPDNGREYKCTVYMPSSNVLEVRGYLGIPAFGRTQNWQRL